MGFDDFFVSEKKDDVLSFFLRHSERLADIQIAHIEETIERYVADNWRVRVAYDYSTWIGAIAYEFEKDARIFNVGLQGANYTAHRTISFPGIVLIHQLTHEQRFRVNGNMPPKFCDFEIWHQKTLEGFEELYRTTIEQRVGPAPYIRIARVPFSIVRPDNPPASPKTPYN